MDKDSVVEFVEFLASCQEPFSVKHTAETQEMWDRYYAAGGEQERFNFCPKCNLTFTGVCDEEDLDGETSGRQEFRSETISAHIEECFGFALMTPGLLTEAAAEAYEADFYEFAFSRMGTEMLQRLLPSFKVFCESLPQGDEGTYWMLGLRIAEATLGKVEDG